jgi:hypothetical protein
VLWVKTKVLLFVIKYIDVFFFICVGLAYPTAITCGVARAARFGVIIRNLDALQTLGDQVLRFISKTNFFKCIDVMFFFFN